MSLSTISKQADEYRGPCGAGHCECGKADSLTWHLSMKVAHRGVKLYGEHRSLVYLELAESGN